MSSLSSRSPLYRRTLLSAVFTPLLFATYFILMVAGLAGFLFPLLIVTLALQLRFFHIPVANPATPPCSKAVLRLNSRIRAAACFFLLVGLLQLPEFKALLKGLNHGSLLRWEVLVPAAALTLMFIYRNYRIMRELSDEQVEAYHLGTGPVRFGGPAFKTLPKLPKPAPAPVSKTTPRTDPY